MPRGSSVFQRSGRRRESSSGTGTGLLVVQGVHSRPWSPSLVPRNVVTTASPGNCRATPWTTKCVQTPSSYRNNARITPHCNALHHVFNLASRTDSMTCATTVHTKLRSTPFSSPPNTRYDNYGGTPSLVAGRTLRLIEQRHTNRTPPPTFLRPLERALHVAAPHTRPFTVHIAARYAPDRLSLHTLRGSNKRIHSNTRDNVACTTRRCEVLRTNVRAEARDAVCTAHNTRVRLYRHMSAHVVGAMCQSVFLSTECTDAPHVDPCTHRPTERIRVRSHCSSV